MHALGSAAAAAEIVIVLRVSCGVSVQVSQAMRKLKVIDEMISDLKKARSAWDAAAAGDA